MEKHNASAPPASPRRRRYPPVGRRDGHVPDAPDPTRLHVLWLLAQGASDGTTLVERTGASRTSVSEHLAKLRFRGLVTAQKISRHVLYSIAGGHRTRLVMEGLNPADHQVTGEPAHD